MSATEQEPAADDGAVMVVNPAAAGAAAAATPSPPPPSEQRAEAQATAAAEAPAPPPPYPGALARPSLRFAHCPELLLFALDVSAEAFLPATRNPAAASSSSAVAAAPPTRYDALASVALLVARAKAALLPPPPADSAAAAAAATASRRRHKRPPRRHRFGLLVCRGARAEFVPGSLCDEPAQLEAALSRLREDARVAMVSGDDSSGRSSSTPAFDFSTLADAAAEAAARNASAAGSGRSAARRAPAMVRVVLLYTRSRAPPPLPLTREEALAALWRARASLPSLHVDVLYAYDPSCSSSSALAAAAEKPDAEVAPQTTTTTAAAAITTTTTPQEAFSRLEACVDALSAAAPHALSLGPPPASSSFPAAAARDAARRNHGYVLDVSVFAPRRLLGAACQLVSHPLQRPALARPAATPDLGRARSVPLPSEAGSRRAQQQQQRREQERIEWQEQQQQQQQQRGDDDDDDDDDDGRDEWGLPLPPPPPPPLPPAPAAAADAADHPISPPPDPLLVDITDQVVMQRPDVASFPVAASGPETDGGEEGEDGGDGGGTAALSPPRPQPPAPSPPRPPAV